MWYELDGNKQAQKTLQKAIYQYSKDVVIPYLEAKKTIEDTQLMLNK